MTIVWPTELDVDGYAMADRDVAAPRPDCPACQKTTAGRARASSRGTADQTSAEARGQAARFGR